MQPRVAAFCFVFSLLWASSSHSLAGDFRIGIAEEYTHLIAVEDGRLKGDIASGYACALSKSGHEFSFKVFPLARLLHELRNGGVDAALPLAHNSARDSYGTITSTVLHSHYLFVSLQGNEFDSEKKGGRFVYVRGFAGESMLHELEGTGVAVSEWDQGINMLRLERVDFLLATEKAYLALSAEQRMGLAHEVVAGVEAAFYVSNNRMELWHSLNDAIAQCEKEASES
ncbi:transporter substrate-binding domain-containing protein [Marinobacter arenosus]|uniref:transporter substrate-binding domain-containing protein n=1 Tax=Marinobacter arenosus TaxID=2856822 RepID=UPI001C4C2FDE|nr:transporter substrate-binding domain-containing protein [Marinobacter arenosus]MBW0146180.1 transporter substrate-binding domain-containing protein [Marinobacter arenosus]